MGYHVTILKTERRKPIPIGKDEFISVARQLPELRVNEATGQAEMYSAGKLRATLVWNNGEIWTKVPESDVIEVMLRIAGPLNARVRGDELETYKTGSEMFIHPDDKLEAENAEAIRKELVSKHRRKQRAWNIFRIVMLTIVVALLIMKWLRK